MRTYPAIQAPDNLRCAGAPQAPTELTASVPEAAMSSVPSCSSRLTAQDGSAIARQLDISIRQLQIIQRVFDGLDGPGIGKALGVSPHTVHAHLARLYRTLGVTSRCELIVQVFLAYLESEDAGGGPCHSRVHALGQSTRG